MKHSYSVVDITNKLSQTWRTYITGILNSWQMSNIEF